jgi:hypothetical protein
MAISGSRLNIETAELKRDLYVARAAESGSAAAQSTGAKDSMKNTISGVSPALKHYS